MTRIERKEESVERLERVLHEEVCLSERLLEVAKKKRELLVRLEVEGIAALNREEESLTATLVDVSSRRLQLAVEVGASVGIAGDQARLTALAPRLGEERGETIRKWGDRLLAVVKEVRRLTEGNRRLAEQSLSFVRDFFELLSGSGQDGRVYSRRGWVRQPPAQLLVDRVV